MQNGVQHAQPPAVAVVAADRRVRESLASLLSASGGVRLLGAVGDPDGAIRLVSGGGADIVVVDRSLAGNGHRDALLPRLRREAPETRIVVIDWDGAARPGGVLGADLVLDLADQPAALLEAVLTPAR